MHAHKLAYLYSVLIKNGYNRGVAEHDPSGACEICTINFRNYYFVVELEYIVQYNKSVCVCIYIYGSQLQYIVNQNVKVEIIALL